MVTLNTVDAAIGNAFNQTQVRELPLQTRNVVELLSLQPGVTQTGEVLGSRRDQNNVTLDGVDANDNQNAGLGRARPWLAILRFRDLTGKVWTVRVASTRLCRCRSILYRNSASPSVAKAPNKGAAPAAR